MIDLFLKIRDLITAIGNRDWPGAESALLAIAALQGAGGIAAEFDKLLAALRGGQIKAIIVEAGKALTAVGQLLPDSLGRAVVIAASPGPARQSE